MSTTNPPNRPTTPLRSTSRTSLRISHTPNTTSGQTPSGTPSSHHHQQQTHPSLHSPLLHLEPALAELSDSLADLEANMQLLQLQHESVARFTENFAAFLYGIDMNAYCVDWTQAPTKESWERVRRRALDSSADDTIVAAATPKGMTPKGKARDAAMGAADASILSTASTRTTSTSGNNASRLRTPARKSGIARGRGLSSRPGSSTSGARPAVESGGRGRGVRGGRAGMGAGTGRGRGDAQTGRGAGGTVPRGGRGRGIARGLGRGNDIEHD